MSRKSISKNTEQCLWWKCGVCLCYITSRDRDTHEKKCGILETIPSSPKIKESNLFTNDLDSIENSKIHVKELENLTEKQSNFLIFMSKEVIRLCNMKIGESVAIYFKNEKNISNPPIVRLIWPIDDKYLGQVFFSTPDYELNWKQVKGKEIQIKKLQSDPVIAKEVILEAQNEELNDKLEIDHLEKLLQIFLQNQILAKGSIIPYKFLNKIVSFKIKNFKSIIKYDNSDALEEKLQDLTLEEDQFISCNKSTRVIIERKFLECTKESSESFILLSDVAGLDDVIETIKENIMVALKFNNSDKKIKIPRGLLLYGPSGCGKSFLVEALCQEFKIKFNVNITRIKSNEIYSKYFGETERNLQSKFDEVFNVFPKPSIIVIEDINNLCPKNETSDISKRVSIAFLNLLDSLHLKLEGSLTFVIATTINVDKLHSGLRRFGRFDTEIEISAPNPKGRYDILQKKLLKIEHSLNDIQINEISTITHGFVGSDLANLIYKAAMFSIRNSRNITIEDIKNALNFIKPSAMREVLIESPNVKWDEIGGQHELKLKLKQAIEWPLLYPEKFKKLGIKPPRGILMYGPPGCSKTMIAKALATESHVNFLSIKGPDLFSMWVGESERAVRDVFRKARQVSPAIIFFDEIDAIGGERSTDGQSSSVKERVLTQLLTEIDGVEALNDVSIVAATNRPDLIDKALLRPGRIDRLVYVGLPDEITREEIFKIKLKGMPVAKEVKIEDLIKLTKGYSGAEIYAVCQEAALKALEENIDTSEIEWKHFVLALELVKPRTSEDLLQLYEKYLKEKI